MIGLCFSFALSMRFLFRVIWDQCRQHSHAVDTKMAPSINLRKSKVELHVHLDGALRLTTIIELAREKGISLPAYTPTELKKHVSIHLKKRSKPTLEKFLNCFKIFIPIIKGDERAIERIAYEFCEDQANCGVFYFETRYCPHLLASCGFDGIKETRELNVTPSKVVAAVNRGLRQGQVDFNIIAKSILCCMRHKPEWSFDILKLCNEYRDAGVVGIDLAGDESQGEVPAVKDHVMAFEEARRLGIHRTVHAGEAGPAASVREALDQLHAERIGHGYHILEDPVLYDQVIERGIHLEVCPTSSLLTGAVKPCFAKHPVRKFAEDGINYSINSDDPLVCDTNEQNEYRVAYNKIELNAAELTRATFNAAKAAFIPDDEKRQLIEYLKEVHGIPGAKKLQEMDED
ncbi:adenosine deaminase-like [Actinia tenebrosa]|uniref:Adenosine deaminase n=1 Tax=Actinia tenebrosa TaxID=6105 RepID=A0A6P8HN78_ACTTE|nr:adenosine deaminase-like [Actinia tenebrosa]